MSSFEEFHLYQEAALIFICGCASLISSFLRKKLLKEIKEISDSPVLSIKDFIAGKANNSVILCGVSKSLGSNKDYSFAEDLISIEDRKVDGVVNKIKNIFSRKVINDVCFDNYNFRIGKVEKLNFFWKMILGENSAFRIGLRLFLFSNTENFQRRNFMIDFLASSPGNSYLIDGDLIGAYLSRNENSKGIFEFKYRFQGNKFTLLSYIKNKIIFLGKLSSITKIFFIFSCFNFVFKSFYRLFKKPMISKLEDPKIKCRKCQINISNVVFARCNHFNMCFTCFEAVKKICLICNELVNDYFILSK